MQEWAKAETASRNTPERGYDDPTAHCFVAGVPRSMYVPGYMQILQPPDTSSSCTSACRGEPFRWTDARICPDEFRLWQGDSVGRWEGDTLVVETTNLNGKAWLNEVGEIISHAERVVERLTPLDADTIQYEATVIRSAGLHAPVDDRVSDQAPEGRDARGGVSRRQRRPAALEGDP